MMMMMMMMMSQGAGLCITSLALPLDTIHASNKSKAPNAQPQPNQSVKTVLGHAYNAHSAYAHASDAGVNER
jgi:hypothetical protein